MHGKARLSAGVDTQLEALGSTGYRCAAAFRILSVIAAPTTGRPADDVSDSREGGYSVQIFPV